MEIRNKKHPHYPAGMIVNVDDHRASQMVSEGLWEKVDSAVVIKKKKA